MRRVAIFQTYVPGYREAFFNRLRDDLSARQIECEVLAGVPEGNQRARSDAVELDWVRPHRVRWLNLGFKKTPYYAVGQLAREFDGIVLTIEGTSPDVYTSLLGRSRGRYRVGLWGHVNSYVRPGNRLDLALEAWSMRRADHVFAYTESGAATARRQGVTQEKVTTVMNTVDTTDLRARMARLTVDELRGFRVRHGLTDGLTVAYIGGLDEAKRIDFLASALEELWVKEPRLRLLVCGRGVDEHLLDPAVARGQVIMLGYADTALKALVGGVAQLLLIPGRIGLVAVEALAARLPIVTTPWPFHGPEVEYLTEGWSRFTSADTVTDYATLVTDLLGRSDGRLDRVRRAAPEVPSLEAMAGNFARGLETMLS